MLSLLPAEHTSLVNWGKDHEGTKGGKNHSNHLKKLSVQDILENVYYFSASYTEIKSSSTHRTAQCTPKHWVQHLRPWVQGKALSLPQVFRDMVSSPGATSCLCSGLIISNCNSSIRGVWWCFKKAIHSLFGTFSRQLLCVPQRPFKNNLKYIFKYPLFNFIPTDLFIMTPSSFQHGLVEEIKNTLTLQVSPLNPKRRLCSRPTENLYTSLIKWQIARG